MLSLPVIARYKCPKMKTPVSLAERRSIAQLVLSWKHTPYGHQGRLPGPDGLIDCAGIPVCAAKVKGFLFSDVRGYSRYPEPEKLQACLDEACVRIDLDDYGIGDILLWTIAGTPRHVGVVVPYPSSDGLGVVHAYQPRAGKGRVQYHALSHTWKKRIVGVWRFCKEA